MENSYLPKNDLELHEAFGIIMSIETFSKYISDIAELVYNENIDVENLNAVLEEYDIAKIQDIKEELLDLLIVYINLILNDHILTENEKTNVQLLKTIFRIDEGDFYKFRYDEVEDILNRQFIRIYRDDDKIDQDEALHKVALQQLFDLSYDQFLEFKEKEIISALERGADLKDLDTVFKLPQYANTEGDTPARGISQKVKDLVWNRDGGQCVICGSNRNLEFDHIIPYSKGGSNTYRNIQLLCEPCNRRKSNKIG